MARAGKGATGQGGTKLRKVLVANRGEIAIRVMAALRERGIVSVAVYSEADARAAHVRAADEAVAIGPAPATESYLVIDRIVRAAKDAGADAIHPGYGFLAENAVFAAAVEKAGVVFLGPRPDTIELLGDKRRARALAGKVGVPVVPGWEGDASDLAGAKAAATAMGFPVLVKAALGGGGKGMTRVDDEEGLAEALATASRVAASAFGDAAVFLEKRIAKPRHVEVQILGDGEGNVIHLAERECTLQRRHQKIVEESPSSAINGKTRDALTSAAVSLCREVKYRSAGTCEFLVDADGRFYFLEVNARIQVEHPVTEQVTGVDLVHEQLHVAETGALRLSQEDIAPRGFAVEARLYAEDPDHGFLPGTGTLLRADFPAGGGLRIDAGVAAGDEISTHYDPMIAKITATGTDRATAWTRLARALDETIVHGPVTNLAFLRWLVAREDVRRGEYHVTSVEEEFLPQRGTPEVDELLVAAVAIAEKAGWTREAGGGGGNGSAAARSDDDPFATLGPWRQNGLGNGA
ncbi:ATP-grasp domain-containing protein [bacterium]|nr:ATP-grasp domain-containing protein [bacterium]